MCKHRTNGDGQTGNVKLVVVYTTRAYTRNRTHTHTFRHSRWPLHIVAAKNQFPGVAQIRQVPGAVPCVCGIFANHMRAHVMKWYLMFGIIIV